MMNVLRIEGIEPALLTPAPDDAELAATLLLESMSRKGRVAKKRKTPDSVTAKYKAIADNIRENRAAAVRTAQRYIAYSEQVLAQAKSGVTGGSSLADLERGLFLNQHAAEREGGELFSRWQHCLAVVTIRLMGIEG